MAGREEVVPFALDEKEWERLQRVSPPKAVDVGYYLFRTGEESHSLFFIIKGIVQLHIDDQWGIPFSQGETVGGFGFLECHNRRGSAVVTGVGTMLMEVTREMLLQLDVSTVTKLYRSVGCSVTSLLSGEDIYKKIDVLLLQDGGCAPGYNTVTYFLAANFSNRFVCAAREGFKSLVSNQSNDFCALISDKQAFQQYSLVPRVHYSPDLRDRRGAAFRAERYPAFREKANQKRAVKCIRDRKIRVLITIGGNGTLAGTRELARWLSPYNVQVFFIPATIDSDLLGTECLGEHTAVEVGAEKLRCYMADAETHKRAYIIEMMGAEGGFHALRSCIGAGANLAVLPNSKIDMKKLATVIMKNDFLVIAVAEGYGKVSKNPEERKARKSAGSAAHYLLAQLRATGILNDEKRVIAEPFSRDIRGAMPNNVDILLAQRFAKQVTDMVNRGDTDCMPTVLNDQLSSLPLDGVETDNSVSTADMRLGDRLGVHL
mmetsp:Transcript_11491/g.32270  ORF Transcript_11491/g.32270 Transcript_11491/m.32270 type:complete len:488 (+) Transcript_11491:57-1520(+)